MKGRTNLGNGIFLNATTALKIVSGANGITAGDFVQYYTTNPYDELATVTNEKFHHFKKIGNDYYVVQVGDTILQVLRYTNDVMEIIHTITSTFIVGYVIIDSTHIVVSETRVVKSYEITTNGLTELSSVSVLTSNPNGYSHIDYDSTTNQILLRSYADVYFVHISNEYILTYSSSTDYLQLKHNNVVINYNNNGFLENNDYYVMGSNTTGSSSNIYKFVLDLNNHTITSSLVGENAYSSSQEQIYILGDNFACISKEYNISSYKLRLRVYSKANLSVVANNSDAYPIISNFIGTNKFIGIDTTRKYAIFEFNEANNTFSVLSNIYSEEISLLMNNASIYAENGTAFVIANMASGSNLKEIARYLSYNDNYTQITGKTSTDYVERWDGSLDVIGVAKDSGESGDTINVYVPSSTY